MEGVNSSTTSIAGVTVVGSDAPSEYHVAPRTNENPPQVSGSTLAVVPHVGGVAQPPATVAGGAGVAGNMTSPLRKKRGRPRKYAPDGSGTGAGAGAGAGAISPKPISSSVPPPVIDFSSSGKKAKIRAPASIPKQYQPRIESESLVPAGEWVSTSVGANFTPHIITVNAGEDVTMKVISFSQQGPRALCILSANGVISSVTLRQPDSSGGTLTYEGRFEILSLTGSFMPTETGGMRNRSGGMSVSLASPDGRVVGGGVAGLLVAASPVQIVVGSFLAGNQHEQKTKKNKIDPITITPVSAIPLSSPDVDDPFRSSTNWSSLTPDSRNKPTDINTNLPG